MTAAKIDALTSCRWPDCTASVARRNLCSRHYCRAQSLVRDGAHWSDDPRVWAALWEDRAARIKAKRRATGLRNLHGVAPVAPPRADAERIEELAKRAAAADQTFSDIITRAVALGMPPGLHAGTWWSTQLTEARERAREMERRANEGAAECERVAATGARLRESLKEIAGIPDTDPTTHADGVIIGRARERMAALHPYRGITNEEAVGLAELDGRARRDADALFRLRAAIADAVGIDGEVPADAVLVRRLRELDSDGDDRNIAVERDVIGTCTATIRKVVCSEQDAVGLAVDGLCAVIELTVGVTRG